MGDELLRVYLDPSEIGDDGYPYAWHGRYDGWIGEGPPAIKDLIRARDWQRCLRCHHPYTKGEGEWSACDDRCTHVGPVRGIFEEGNFTPAWDHPATLNDPALVGVQAQWRILTVHHLNGVKADCRWWNLVSLCQRCHLEIQAKVHLQRRWMREHSEWFKPFVAGYYAWAFLGLELSEEQTRDRLDELLALEDRQLSIEGA